MAYVKISDPNIIDLNAIHNIINVVNQHSDTLNTLTNNFGANNNTSSSADYAAAATRHLFDSANQMVLYGRDYFSVADNSHASTTPAGLIYFKTIKFSDNGVTLPPFTTAAPLVYITTHTGNTSSTSGYSTTFADCIAHVYNITASQFNVRLFFPDNTTSITGSQKIYINWMAIGPKNR